MEGKNSKSPKSPRKFKTGHMRTLTRLLTECLIQSTSTDEGCGLWKCFTWGIWCSRHPPLKDLLKDVLNTVFQKIRVGDAVVPIKDGKSCGYAFVNLSWADASDIDPFDICKLYSGTLFVNSRAIYFSEPIQAGTLPI